MAQKDRCNHAYGLEIVRCTECGSQIASRCPVCAYEGRCDDHGVTCSQGPQLRRRQGKTLAEPAVAAAKAS